jgi:hypothetical protein
VTGPPPNAPFAASTPARLALPELGPYLGRLADATRRFDDPELGLDSLRLAMVTELFERAGAARNALRDGHLEEARATLNEAHWLEIWRRAAGQATDLTIALVRARLQRAQWISGMPDRFLARRLPTKEDREVLGAKLEAAGIPLENQLGRGFPREDGWWEAIRRAAVAVEDSWEQLEDVVRATLRTTEAEVRVVEGWRASPVPWVIALVAAIAATGWVGLTLGGFLPRPGWLDGFHRLFWSIPWP